MTGRRVCIAYSTFAEGRGLLAFVRDMVLTPQDTVYICHVFSKDQNVVSWRGEQYLGQVAAGMGRATPSKMCSMKRTAANDACAVLVDHLQPTINRCAAPQVTKEVMKMARALTLMPQRPESGGSDDVTRDNSLDFGAAELAGFPNLQLGVALQVGTRCRVECHCRQAIAGVVHKRVVRWLGCHGLARAAVHVPVLPPSTYPHHRHSYRVTLKTRSCRSARARTLSYW